MTAKQRAARAKFKAVVAEAKKLRQKNPKLTQAQAVKQAFAISYSKAGKKKVGAVKKSKFEVGDMVYSYQNKEYKAPISYKKFVPWESLSKPSIKDKFVYKLKIKDGYSNWINEESLSKSSLGAVKKKPATKVKAKKSRSTEMHTDTKSHNVNIRVMSGVRDENLRQIDLINSNIIKWRRIMYVLEDKLFYAKDIQEKIAIRKEIKMAKYYIKTLEDTLKEIKKLVK
jgi:hypothetical protein